jgi:hypothetical protein
MEGRLFMKAARTIIFACVFLGAGVIPSHAFDITGTWEGGWTCRVQHKGTFTTIAKDAVTMKVTHSGSTVYMDLDNDRYHYNGWAGADNENANRGALTVVECRTRPTSTVFNEVISARVKTSSAGGEFNGTSTYTFIDPTNTDIGAICKITFKRTSAADPGVGPCPPEG